MESDIINIHVFYNNNERENLVIQVVDEKIKINDNFICTVWYYKDKSIVKFPYYFANKFKLENIDKIGVYWNPNIDIIKGKIKNETTNL